MSPCRSSEISWVASSASSESVCSPKIFLVSTIVAVVVAEGLAGVEFGELLLLLVVEVEDRLLASLPAWARELAGLMWWLWVWSLAA